MSPLELLATPVAVGLLHSRIPARLGYLGRDGTPRIAPLWFHWTGTQVVMATFATTRKLAALATGDRVAVSIDGEEFPYQGLQLRGALTVEPSAGLVPEYVLACRRYLATDADDFLARLGDARMTRLAVDVDAAFCLDMRASDPAARVRRAGSPD